MTSPATPSPQPGDTLPADAITAAVEEARQDCAAAIMLRLDEIPQREIMRISAEAGLRIGLGLGRAQGEERQVDGWPHTTEELLQVAAIAVRILREFGLADLLDGGSDGH